MSSTKQLKNNQYQWSANTSKKRREARDRGVHQPSQLLGRLRWWMVIGCVGRWSSLEFWDSLGNIVGPCFKTITKSKILKAATECREHVSLHSEASFALLLKPDKNIIRKLNKSPVSHRCKILIQTLVDVIQWHVRRNIHYCQMRFISGRQDCSSIWKSILEILINRLWKAGVFFLGCFFSFSSWDRVSYWT